MRKHLPALAVVSAGILWGIISFFIRELSACGLNAVQISFIRMVTAAPAFTVFMLIAARDKMKIRLRDIWMFAGTGIISIVLFNSLYFYTMIHAEASTAVVLLYTSPVFIILLSALIFGERITPVKIAAVLMTVSGCALVAGVSGSSILTPLTLITGLGSGLFYGLYTIFGRFALKKYDTVTVTAYTFIMGMIGSFPVGKPGGILRAIGEQPRLVLWCLGIGLICTVLPYFLYTWGLAGIESGKAAVLAAVEPMVGAMIGMTCFGESRSVTKICGIVMILAAIILPGILSRRPGSDEKAQ